MLYILDVRWGVYGLPSSADRAPPADLPVGHCRALLGALLQVLAVIMRCRCLQIDRVSGGAQGVLLCTSLGQELAGTAERSKALLQSTVCGQSAAIDRSHERSIIWGASQGQSSSNPAGSLVSGGRKHQVPDMSLP
jgi:hypothetical protein